jgi:nitrogen fixation protein NifX
MMRLKLVEPAGTPAPGRTGHMKVAFATQDMHLANAHFGGARNIAIYDVSPDGYRFVEAVRFDSASEQDGVHAHDDGDDRLTPRIDAVDGCAVLFVLAIGGPAAARVVGRKVHPVKLPKPEPIPDILERMQAMLGGTPPPWLRKALKGATAERPDFLDDVEDGLDDVEDGR